MQNKVIGKIERLSVEHFRKPGRKLFLVPLLFSLDKEGKNISKDYLTKIKTYWSEVKCLKDNLQAKL